MKKGLPSQGDYDHKHGCSIGEGVRCASGGKLPSKQSDLWLFYLSRVKGSHIFQSWNERISMRMKSNICTNS
jgi:hypothetical protein